MTKQQYLTVLAAICLCIGILCLGLFGFQQNPATLPARNRPATEDSVCNGSALFWQDGLLVNPILRSTGSHITHAAVILNGYVYEAVPPRVRKVPLDQYVKEMEAKSQTPAMQRRGFKWFIMQPKAPYPDAEVQSMLRYAESQVGRVYMIRGWWKGHGVRGVFCSQLVGCSRTGSTENGRFWGLRQAKFEGVPRLSPPKSVKLPRIRGFRGRKWPEKPATSATAPSL